MNAVISPITRNARSDHESTHQRSSPEENANLGACPVAQRLITGERIETNITELVLCAQANLAMARVAGAFDADTSFTHAVVAKRWAYRAGVAALCGTPIPLGFQPSLTLCEGFRQGQAARMHSRTQVSLTPL